MGILTCAPGPPAIAARATGSAGADGWGSALAAATGTATGITTKGWATGTGPAAAACAARACAMRWEGSLPYLQGKPPQASNSVAQCRWPTLLALAGCVYSK